MLVSAWNLVFTRYFGFVCGKFYGKAALPPLPFSVYMADGKLSCQLYQRECLFS